MVIRGRRGQRAVILMDDLLRLSMFEQVAPGQPEADAAYAALVACGKGNGHPAGLDFGDVFSYALARIQGLPLLHKGADFAQTDIASRFSVQLSGRQYPGGRNGVLPFAIFKCKQLTSMHHDANIAP